MANNASCHPTPDLRFPNWHPQYLAVILETDPQKLQQQLFDAEEAIVRRMESLDNAPNADIEKQAMEEAIRALRVIQIEKLNYPDSKGRRIS